ncbi:unnamed protein product [Penicillium bialowiezense]
MEQAKVPKSAFMFEGVNLSDIHDTDAVWVTVKLLHHISSTDDDERVMQFVVDQIKDGEVVVGTCSLSRPGAQYLPGALSHAQALANWWLEQIREGTIRLDRKHIFGV